MEGVAAKGAVMMVTGGPAGMQGAKHRACCCRCCFLCVSASAVHATHATHAHWILLLCSPPLDTRVVVFSSLCLSLSAHTRNDARRVLARARSTAVGGGGADAGFAPSPNHGMRASLRDRFTFRENVMFVSRSSKAYRQTRARLCIYIPGQKNCAAYAAIVASARHL
jgi:hypothetical protein